MRFKVIGLVALLVGAYFAIMGVVLAQEQPGDSMRAQVYPLVAIFLALVVRVLQAEKHHRDRLKQSAEEETQENAAKEARHAAI